MSVSAETPSAGEARADALLLLAETRLAQARAESSGGDHYQVVIHVDRDALDAGAQRQNPAAVGSQARRGMAEANVESSRGFADAHGALRRGVVVPFDRRGGGRCEVETGAPIARATARRLLCDAAIVALLEHDGKSLDIGRKTRSIPPSLRRALAARDRGCRFPGCGARRFVDAHHIEHWADGGATSLGNLVQLCRHHHRLLHEGGYTISRDEAGTIAFHRRDGRLIPEVPAAPHGRAGALRERQPGDRIRPVAADACVSLSAGERLDLDLGVEALLTYAPPATSLAPGI